MPQQDSSDSPGIPPRQQSLLSKWSGWPKHLSLRTKGIFSLVVIVVYVGLMTAIVTQERLKLPSIVKELERVHALEEHAGQISMQVSRAIVASGEAYYMDQGDLRTKQLFMDLTPLDSALSNAARQHPQLKIFQEQISALTRNIAHAPSKPLIHELRVALQRLAQSVNDLSLALRGEKQALLASYQQVDDRITLQTMFFLFLGVVVVGAVMTIFFTRLTWDIRRAGLRAMAVVKGYRGKPLPVTRGDEVGGLMQAINQMQSELRERERQLEMSRQQQFHHEKMAAVGSLAAAVAHEINNPIMAISGLAEVLHSQEKQGGAGVEDAAEISRMIIDQAKRIATITRHISEFATPQSPDPHLVDLNSIVRNTANFVRFDQRYRRIELVVEEDRQLAPVIAVADHVTQILINLLINAADATDGVLDRKPRVIVSTRQDGDEVAVSVEDNGGGMPPEVLARACEEFFTTKPRGKGSGLGLFLSKNLLEENGGQLDIESSLNRGTRVSLRFSSARHTEN